MSDEARVGPILERIDEGDSGFSGRAVQAESLAESTSRLSGTARDGDRLAKVAVGPRRRIADLWLDGEIRRELASATARQILAAVRDAHEALVRQVDKVAAAETVGADSETGPAVLADLNDRLGLGEESP